MRPTRDDFTQTIILAAGNGSRLGGGHGVPKPLTKVGGVPLIAHALSQARSSGCIEALIVVGHEGARVRAAVEQMATGLRVRFVTTPDPSSPNGVSLLATEALAARHFFLQMVDHVFSAVVLPRLTASPFEPAECGRVLVDRTPGADVDLEDATKVRLLGSLVVAIGKGIEPWEAVDAGCFALTDTVFAALRQVPASDPRTVSSGMQQMASRGSLGAVALAGVEWTDVDTPSDREVAERVLAGVSQRPL